MSLKLVEDKVKDDKPSLLPLPTLGTTREEVAADLCALVSRFHLSEDGGETHTTLTASLKTGCSLS